MRLLATKQHGLTLIEILVSIGIIGALVALLLPAIQAARESGRRGACANNLKQIGVALASHENTYQRFPVGAQSRVLFGTSWWVQVLPGLEQSALYEKLDRDGPNSGSPIFHAQNAQAIDGISIPVMVCPSSPIEPLKKVGNVYVMMPSYVGISGSSSHGNFPETRIASCCIPENQGEISAGGVLIPNASVRAADILDGLSNTFVVGECSDYCIDIHGRQQRIDGGFPNGWLTGTTARGTPPDYSTGFSPPCWNITTVRHPPNTRKYELPGIDDNRGANNPLISPHPGGVYFLRADGSVQFVEDEIELRLLKRLATRDDVRLRGEN